MEKRVDPAVKETILAAWDKTQSRPEPDKELMNRAHNLMLKTETPMQRYVRQQWECAMGATSVALDAWRRVWPQEASDSLHPEEWREAQEAELHLGIAYLALDRLSEALGGVRYQCEVGLVASDELAEMEREEAEDGNDQT